jgi:hypothetical protein
MNDLHDKSRLVPGAEAEAVRNRYLRRSSCIAKGTYSPLNAEVWQSFFERQRAMLRLFNRLGLTSVTNVRLLEVGCGAGGNLLEFLRLGFPSVDGLIRPTVDV